MDNIVLAIGALLGLSLLSRGGQSAPTQTGGRLGSFFVSAEPTLPGLTGMLAVEPGGGIFPDMIAEPRVVISVEDGNTPVIDQRPIFQVQGSNNTGFQLIGSAADLGGAVRQ